MKFKAKKIFKKITRVPFKLAQKSITAPLKLVSGGKSGHKGGGLVSIPAAAEVPAPVSTVAPQSVAPVAIQPVVDAPAPSPVAPPPVTPAPVVSPSGYNPEVAFAETAKNFYPVSIPYVTSNAASAPVSPSRNVSSSGYDPEALSRELESRSTLEGLGKKSGKAGTKIKKISPKTPMSEEAMRNKLLAVKKSNPEYYAFLVEYLRSHSGKTVSQLGEIGADTSDWSSKLSNLFTGAAQAYTSIIGAKAQAGQLTPAQAQAQLAAMQSSNATLSGNDKTGMYIIGAALLAGLTFILTRK